MIVLRVVAVRFIGSAESGGGGIRRVAAVGAALGFWKRMYFFGCEGQDYKRSLGGKLVMFVFIA